MPIPRFTATDRMEFIESICGAVFEEGHQPPFTITIASPRGTVHTYRVCVIGKIGRS